MVGNMQTTERRFKQTALLDLDSKSYNRARQGATDSSETSAIHPILMRIFFSRRAAARCVYASIM